MRLSALILAVATCSPVVAPEPAEPCVTYVVSEWGDTARFVDLAVPPENLSAVREWWTEGDCP